jgi:NADH dehydrogenase
MLVYVTGAGGFLGRHLLPRLVSEGKGVRALLLPGEPVHEAGPGVETVRGDVTRPETLAGHLAGVDAVVHLAGVVASPDRERTLAVNHQGTLAVLQEARTAGVGLFVHMSAAAAKFKSQNAYARSKRLAEEAVTASGLPHAILRTPLLIGRGCEEFDRFVDYVKAFPVVPVFGDGKAVKRPLHVEDATAALAALLEIRPAPNRIYELACREEVSLDMLIDAVLAAMGKPKPKVHIPLGVSMALARMAEILLGSRAPVNRDILLGMNEDVDFEIGDALSDLGVEPIRLEAALKDALGEVRT